MKPTANGTNFDAKTFYKECTCGSPIDENLECHEKQLMLEGRAVICPVKFYVILS